MVDIVTSRIGVCIFEKYRQPAIARFIPQIMV